MSSYSRDVADLFKAMGGVDRQPAQPVDNDTLRRIADAVELSAALAAGEFFKGCDPASERLTAVISKLTTRLVHRHEGGR